MIASQVDWLDQDIGGRHRPPMFNDSLGKCFIHICENVYEPKQIKNKSIIVFYNVVKVSADKLNAFGQTADKLRAQGKWIC